VSDQAVLHMEDTAPAQLSTVATPNAVAAPIRSLFQTEPDGLVNPLNYPSLVRFASMEGGSKLGALAQNWHEPGGVFYREIRWLRSLGCPDVDEFPPLLAQFRHA